MRKILMAIISVLVAIAGFYINPAQAIENTIDLSNPGSYLLGICETKEQLDCLQPEIIIWHGDGSKSQAILIDSQVRTSHLDNSQNTLSGFHRFKASSGDLTGKLREFNIRVSLTAAPGNPLAGLNVNIVGVGKKLGEKECDAPLSKLCSRFTLDPEDVFQLAIRSQEIPVHWLGVHAQNGDIEREKYLNGVRWNLRGSQTLLGWNPGLWWSIVAVDSQSNLTLDKKIFECSIHGAVFKASNEVSGGMPSWNYKSQSLDFGVSGPHFDANGDLFKGFFKARIPKKWLDCMYPGNSLSAANQISVSIVYDDGTVQVASTQTKVTDNLISIEVPVLHFSSPTIRVSNAALAPKATPKSTPKTISCTKGKVKKKVSASKCPSGWKLVA